MKGKWVLFVQMDGDPIPVGAAMDEDTARFCKVGLENKIRQGDLPNATVTMKEAPFTLESTADGKYTVVAD